MPRGSWIFLRAYLLVVALVVVTGLGLEALLAQRDEQSVARREAALVRGAFELAEEEVAASGVADPDRFERQLAATIGLPVKLLSLADFASLREQFRQLQGGDILQLYDSGDQPIFHRRLGSSDWVLAVGPAPALDNERVKWVVPLFYGLIALAVFLWIRPLLRDLNTLRDAARRIGEQDFATRADIPAGSWLSPLAEAFNSMARRIEWLLQSHRELTQAVSHELRTPLARLRFGLEMFSSASAEDRERHLASMNSDIDELNDLIEEMLGYAELEQGNLTPSLARLDLARWLTQYVADYNERNPRIPLQSLAQASSLPVVADERLLNRAMDNLVGNAQRFARGRIQVRATLAGSECRLCVMDDGPGIPQEQREAVLSAYVQLQPKAGSGRREGFGLGLAIVKRITDLHRGRIEVATASLGGAEIALILPRD